MGKVIALQEATRVASSDSALVFIDECYARLQALPDFVMRPGQRDLSYDVCKALVANEPIAAEAPTGTGKTIAYLVGAIAAAEKLRVIKDIPIVVATATVGLQSQILTGDLPKLVDAGIINANDPVLAKGRGRYFCASAAERLLDGKALRSQVDFFDEDANKEAIALEDVSRWLDAWRSHSWTGDIDSYKGAVPKTWSLVAAANETCVAQKCDHYNVCPFFNARRALSSARVIIANHDLVLADLAMAKEGQEPLFSTDRYLVVFDEAHHLPDKALDAGSASFDFEEVSLELPKLLVWTRIWQKQGELARLMDKQKLNASDFDPQQLLSTLEQAKAVVDALEVDESTKLFRFENGELPADLFKSLELAYAQCQYIGTSLKDAIQAIKQTNVGEKSPLLAAAIQELLFLAAGSKSVLSSLEKALLLLTGRDRAVRWVDKGRDKLRLMVCPLEGAQVLQSLMWGTERVRVAMVSATLKDFDGFERFAARCGAPTSLRTKTLPHIFPYRESTMYLVQMQSSPRQDEKEAFRKELMQALPRFINPNEGTLVLFPSHSLMSEMMPRLRAQFGSAVIAQNDKGIKELVSDHKKRIDEGKGSVLCGLATLAEGLDLPGKYCTHVLICALPFTAPTTPVEQELQEVMGKDYFEKRALPDTLVKMVQMVGRLMRRESDRGRITIFDKRLIYTKWGRKMLGALPGFKRQIVSPEQPPQV